MTQLKNKVTRLVAIIALALGGLVGMAGIGAEVAHAYPAGMTGCYTRITNQTATSVVGACNTGPYAYQVRLFCADNYHAGQGYYAGGPWRNAPIGSYFACASGYSVRNPSMLFGST